MFRRVVLVFLALAACKTAPPARATPTPGASEPTPMADYGTPDPMFVQRVSSAGRWLVACQARTDTDGTGDIAVTVGHHGDLGGDVVRPYLFLTPGAGEGIEDVVTTEPSGRWLVVLQAQRLVLIDALTHLRVTLDGVSASLGPERFTLADFDPDATRVVYLRQQGARRVGVVRELESGHEALIDPGVDGVLTVSFLNAKHVGFQLVVDDTDHDGTLAWPRRYTTMAEGPCVGEALSASFGPVRGDAIATLVAPSSGGPSRRLAENERLVGTRVVTVETGRRIAAAGLEWAGASCQPEVVLVDHPTEQLLVRCAAVAGNDLYLAGPGGLAALGVAFDRSEPISRQRAAPWMLRGQNGLEIDLQAKKARRIPGASSEGGTGTRALWTTARSDTKLDLVVMSALSDDRRAFSLERDLDDFHRPFSTERLVSLEGQLIDLETAKVVGRVPPHVRAMTPGALFLVVDGRGRDTRGPVRWVHALQP